MPANSHAPTPTPDTRVYHVSSDRDVTVLVALDLVVEDRIVRWFDTVKERVMTAERMEDARPARFMFERSAQEGGGRYIFVPMTLELYRTSVRSRLTAGGEFGTEAEMLAAFASTRDSAW